MIQERSIELSVVKFMRGILDPSVNAIDEVEEEETMSTPTVATYWVRKTPRYIQEGDARGFDIYYWQAVIYASTKTQRDNIAYSIYEHLANHNIEVFDFSNTTDINETSLSRLGVLLVDRVLCDPIRSQNPIPDKLRYQTLITFQTVFQED